MLFFRRKKKRSPSQPSIRSCLISKYKHRYFISSKLRRMFEATILVVDNDVLKNENDFRKFTKLPNVKLLVLRNLSITTLPELPYCEKLYTKNTCLQSLPPLPHCRYVDVGFNNLTVLDKLPKCRVVHCESNKIHTVDNLLQCKRIYCNNNRLQSLPSLPSCLYLSCSNNNITSVPYLTKCRKMILHQNPIESIIVNNKTKVFFRGKKNLQIFRFKRIHDCIFNLLVSYNIWHNNHYLTTPITVKVLSKLNSISDNKSNLIYLHSFLKNYYTQIESIHPKDHEQFEILKIFYHWKYPL